jgi:hypothetical protein
MRGLDPRIHRLRKKFFAMDCRVNPGNDGLSGVARIKRSEMRGFASAVPDFAARNRGYIAK